MSRRYGLPYMGSKSKIAEWVVSHLPRATHLYDIFSGGGAITHCALLSGKWKCVHFSDISNSVELLRDCFDGNFPDGSEWISREDFFARKDEEPYIRLLWSFGNDGRSYLYGKDIEPYKKAVHEMIFAPTPNERRLKFREVCKLIPSVLGFKGGAPDVSPRVNGEIAEATYRLQHLEPNPPPLTTQSPICQSVASPAIRRSLQQNPIELHRLQSEERRRACEEFPFFGGEYECRIADYRDIEILPDSIIYADKPYINTGGYGDTGKDDFDHDAFWQWTEEQDVPVFISEYWAPEDRFKCIASKERTSTFSATNNGLKKIEKIFVPLKWYDKFKPIEQKSLFDDI
ncbi:DNA adenine methylase [Clavibacter sp.]|uniref:DNA adenine methylase n=1 Tax=Clavibacter sp. TaxID=1871044 RepID=UPI0019C68A7A|nr:DNA adenine methylase [Clavibacter sp.]MBD5382001.1 hypothetical protein [Clavibacter sp.]